MIRLTALLHRNHALTSEEFRQHWEGRHAALMRDMPHVGDYVLRYEQHPRLVAPGGAWTGSQGYDGMAVQWFADLDAFTAMTRDPDYRQQVAPDERHLLDMTRSAFLLTDEPRVIVG